MPLISFGDELDLEESQQLFQVPFINIVYLNRQDTV